MTVDEAIEQARWYEREDIATTLRESANVLADECERLRERVKVLEAALRAVLALADKLDRDGMAEAVSVGDCYARAATRECAAEVRALAETGGSDAR